MRWLLWAWMMRWEVVSSGHIETFLGVEGEGDNNCYEGRKAVRTLRIA